MNREEKELIELEIEDFNQTQGTSLEAEWSDDGYEVTIKNFDSDDSYQQLKENFEMLGIDGKQMREKNETDLCITLT